MLHIYIIYHTSYIIYHKSFNIHHISYIYIYCVCMFQSKNQLIIGHIYMCVLNNVAYIYIYICVNQLVYMLACYTLTFDSTPFTSQFPIVARSRAAAVAGHTGLNSVKKRCQTQGHLESKSHFERYIIKK